MSSSIKYLPRRSTQCIVIHVLTCLPVDLASSPVAVRLAFVGGLSLHSEGFHFCVDSNAEVHDGRDSRTLGAYRSDSIDIFLLCVDEDPSPAQERELSHLIEALQLDYPDQEQLQVHRFVARFTDQQELSTARRKSKGA